MKPSIALDLKRDAVRETASRFHTANPRLFGSVLHGDERDGSDFDLLVDALPGATLFDLGDLQVELEELLGVPVDLLTPGDLPLKFLAQVLAEARSI
jgi:uncharacterized protein